MSIPRIVGIPADPAGDNPVAVRGVQIEGSSLQAAIGFPETPVYTNRPDFPSERRYWQYYGNGMISVRREYLRTGAIRSHSRLLRIDQPVRKRSRFSLDGCQSNA